MLHAGTKPRFGVAMFAGLVLALGAFAGPLFAAEAVFDIPRLDKIAIDGRADDWGDGGFQVPMMPNEKGLVKPMADFDPCMRLAWDARGLLVLIQMSQAQFHESADPKSLWSADSVELFVASQHGGLDLVQFVFSPGMDPRHPEARQQAYDYRKTVLEPKKPVCSFARTAAGNRCSLEILIPWSNYGIEPKVGREIGVQAWVNDSRDHNYRAMWFPALGAQEDSKLMQRVRLAESASAAPAKIACGFVPNRLPCVCVAGGGELVGRRVTVKEGGRAIVEGVIPRQDGRVFLELALPYPPASKTYGPLEVLINGESAAKLDLPKSRAPVLSVEIVGEPKGDQPTLLRPDFEGAGDAFPSVAVELEVLTPQGERAARLQGHLQETLKADLRPGWYSIRLRAPDFFGRQLKSERALYVGADMNAALREALGHGHAAQDVPELKDYAGWFAFQASQIADQLAFGTEQTKQTAVEAAASLEAWISKAKRNPRALQDQRGVFEWAYLSAADGSGQPFTVGIPQDYSPERSYSLLIKLHGSGGTHLNALHNPYEKPYVLLAPMGRARSGGYSCLAETDVLEAIDYVRKHWNIAPDRIHLSGTSMGGGGTFFIAARHPDMFASAVPLCGYGFGAPGENMLHVPVWAVHGTADRTVVIASSRAPLRQLAEIGGVAILDELEGSGHNLAGGGASIARAEAWADRQTLPARVHEIRYTAMDEIARGAYWLEVVEWGTAALPARVHAVLREDNVLCLAMANVATLGLDLVRAPADRRQPLTIVIDEHIAGTLSAPLPERAYLTLAGGKWTISATAPELPPARLHFPGGAAAIYHGEPILVVWGTHASPELNSKLLAAAESARRSCHPGWVAAPSPKDGASRETMLYGQLPGKPDTDVTDADLQGRNLLLIGTAEQNSVVARLAKSLPVRIENGRAVASDGPSWSLKDRALGLLYYNPLAPRRLIYWVASESPEFYRAGTPLMAAQWYGNAADLLIMGAKEEQAVAARSFDSRWNWEAGYAASPLLTPESCAEGRIAAAFAEAMRAATGSDLALVWTPEDEHKLNWAPNESRRMDLVTWEGPGDLAILELSGKDLLSAAQFFTKAPKARCRFLPAVAEADLQPDRLYRVALRPWTVGDYTKLLNVNPPGFRLTTVTIHEALVRYLRP